jgi:hypothetical protein
MKSARFGQVLGLSMLAFGTVAAACSSSGDVQTTDPADAGKDVTIAVDSATTKDAAGAVDADAAEACDIDADLLSVDVPADLPDSGIDVDTCVTCARANCKSAIAACNANCDCLEAVGSFLTCYLGGGSVQLCGAPLLGARGEARNLGTAVALCIGQKCGEPCAPAEGTPDASTSDGSTSDGSASDGSASDGSVDGSRDASSDGASDASGD